MTEKWLSVHIHISGRFEPFLKHLQVNLLRPLQDAGSVDSFFFIRYYDTGPHVRLRLSSDPERLQGTVLPALLDYLQVCLAESTEGVARSYIVQSYAFIEYEPELERYGGLQGIGLAEKHFDDSSRAVLSHIVLSEEHWNYDTALGAALQLHLSFFFSLSLLPETIGLLLDLLYLGWLPAVLAHPSLVAGKSDPEAAIEEAYGNSYSKQQIGLREMATALEDIIRERDEAAPLWLWSWERDVISTHQDIMELVNREADDPAFSRVQAEAFAVELYQSYFHMTNNRLGLQNVDESFIGYILRRVLQDIGYLPTRSLRQNTHS